MVNTIGEVIGMVSPGGSSPLDEAREELLREASLSAEASGREKAQEETGPVRSLLVFFLGAEGFAVDLAHVRKVLRADRIARVSGAAPEVLGLMNCQGEVLCVLDLRTDPGDGEGTGVDRGDGGEVDRRHPARREGCGVPGRRGPGRRWTFRPPPSNRCSIRSIRPASACSRGRWRAAGNSSACCRRRRA